MKIHSVTLYQYKRPFREQERSGLLLHLQGSSGEEGWGEIAPLSGFSNESLREATDEVLGEIPHLLKGRWNLSHLSPSAHFGIESALLDLLLPIVCPPFPVNALFTKPLGDMQKHTKSLQGYRSVKIKVGHLSLSESLSFAKECSSTLPPNMQVRIDANQSWTLEEALTFAHTFPKNRLEYFEEPLKSFKDYASFPHPVALDESIRTLPMRQCFSLPHLKALIIKPTLMGGRAKLLPLLKKAREKRIAFILSSSYESELGISLLAKLAVRLTLPRVPMGLDTYRLFKQPIFEERIEQNLGKVIFPEKWTLKTPCIIAHECI